MDYSDLKGKTIFDFCNDASVLAKVTGFSDPLASEKKEYIEGFTPLVHAQMLSTLAIETDNKELGDAAEKLQYELWKELHTANDEDGDGYIID